MGHQRLGTLPDTAPWRKIVCLLAEDGDAAAVATATTQAALHGLELAARDEGLVQSVVVLAQVAQAARTDEFGPALRRAGIPVQSHDPDFFDLLTGFNAALDRHLGDPGKRTDLTEMAQLAGIEALARLVRQKAEGLYGTSAETVRRAAYEMSTRTGFGVLAHELFGRFLQRFLTYHLGRELSLHVGGNGRFADPAGHEAFVDQLEVHCGQAAAIMKRYAADWYDKTNRLTGIAAPATRKFVAYAVTKLRGELERRGTRHG